MILTPLDIEVLPRLLDVFDAGLEDTPLAREVFRRIAATREMCPGLIADLHAGRNKAIALAEKLGIPTRDEEPQAAFSWDGQVIRTRSETSVVFHEIAHWQLAGARRARIDFGLGAGPESGRVDEANAAVSADAATREHEENLASLLGILWEVEHDEPALLAFAEQNWLELAERPHTHAHFVQCLQELMDRGLVNTDGRPKLERNLGSE